MSPTHAGPDPVRVASAAQAAYGVAAEGPRLPSWEGKRGIDPATSTITRRNSLDEGRTP
jgi:hypothetical protein